MKRRWKLLAAVLLPTLLAAFAFFYWGGEPDIASDSWLWLEVGELPDQSQEASLLQGPGPLGILELRTILRRAKVDSRVDGCVLDLGRGIPAHRCEEVALLVSDFLSVGKPVKVFANAFDLASWVVASHGSEVILHPAGMVDLRSPSGMIPFFGGALKRFGVEPDILRHGEHKAIYEQFAHDAPSPELQLELSQMHEARWEHVRSLCQRRQKGIEQVRAAAGVGPMSPREALEGSWIDAIEDAATIQAEFAQQGISVFGSEIYREVSADTVGIDGEGVIAVLSIEGTLAATEASSLPLMGKTQGIGELERGIEEIRQDPNVRGVLVRIESPGGDAFTSEEIWQALTRLQRDYPMVALMGSQATSGGYYAAVAAPLIYASPSTVTGSIGIVGLRFRPQGLLDRLGVHTHVIREAEFGAPAIWEVEDEESRQLSLKALQDAYELFVERVDGGRAFDRARARELADGRVYRGQEAFELGLVDGVGGWDQAWQQICSDSGQLDPEKTRVEIFPRSRSLFQRLRNVDPTELTVDPQVWLEPFCAEQRWFLGPILGW